MSAFEVVDAVQNGAVECAYTVGYYFVGKNKAIAFDTTLPFGLSHCQQKAWMYYGGGKQLIGDFMREFGIVSFPDGDTGVQIGGWFRKELKTVKDLNV